jgi:hypothetical protein
MCQPRDILWIKNVKRNEGREWAYSSSEIRRDRHLVIHFPERSNPRSPHKDELILLFQKLQNGVTYFSHLGRFVDNIVHESDRNRYPQARKIEVLNCYLDNHNSINLHYADKSTIYTAPHSFGGGVSQGHACRLGNMTYFTESGNDLLRRFQEEIWTSLYCAI